MTTNPVKRAKNRVSIRHCERELVWSNNVLSKFGRISAELQEAAVYITLTLLPKDVRVVLNKHVPWHLVAKVHKKMRNPKVRLAWKVGKNLQESSKAMFGSDDPAELLCPEYPRMCLEGAALIRRGHSPRELSEYTLTDQEAHEWASTMPWAEPLQFMWHRLPGQLKLTDIKVARWAYQLVQTGKWVQMTKVRKLRPYSGGYVVEGCYADRLPDLIWDDLTDGLNTAVSKAFANAHARLGKQFIQRALADNSVISVLPAAFDLDTRYMRLLDTPAKLAREGREMDHCSAHSVQSVKAGNYVFSVDINGHRSTVEIDDSHVLVQHYGPSCFEPHTDCKQVVEDFLNNRIKAVFTGLSWN